ncbi:cation:proton antiporter [Agromyces humi]|uniref:cation:proton antiporter n=1 Tax=Agromyces humi TaxID=1766800 RepID=UPI001357190A|nr:sodium:proton antiporter [Agromyces humi]
MDPVTAVVWTVAFVVVTVSVTGLTRRLNWSAPVVLVIVGGIASFIPIVPVVHVEPELVLYGVLPPLLFAQAVRTSFIDVRRRRDSILILSVGTVAFTVIVVGLTTSLLLPAIGLAAAFAFAAVIAPTDTVAVTSVTGRLALPRRVVTVLEGESLLNDAAALVALNAAIAAMTTLLSPLLVAGEFLLAVAGGVAVGLAIGWTMAFIRSRLRSPVLDTSLALITPYLAFIAAEAVLGSGVLAVVIAGLYLGYRSPVVQSAEARIAESVNWRTIQFLLENAVFLFIGLNLASILQGAIRTGPGLWATIGICSVVFVTLVVSRFAFVLAVAWFFRRGPRRLRRQHVQWKNAVVIAAANVRGVVTLAAVFLLPEMTPDREFLQFLAFVIVVATLVSGLALPVLVRRLHLPPPNAAQEQMERETLMAEAHAAGLGRLELEIGEADEERVVSQLRANATLISDSLEHPAADPSSESFLASYARLRRTMIAEERRAVLAARSEGRFPETAVKFVLRAIDAEELSLNAITKAPDAAAPRPQPADTRSPGRRGHV